MTIGLTVRLSRDGKRRASGAATSAAAVLASVFFGNILDVRGLKVIDRPIVARQHPPLGLIPVRVVVMRVDTQPSGARRLRQRRS